MVATGRISRKIEEILCKNYWWSNLKVYCDLEGNDKTLVIIERKGRDTGNLLQATKKSKRIEKYKGFYSYQGYEREVEYDEIICESERVENIFNKLNPQYKNIYLKNGKLKGGIKNNE
jgi:hypothetical protein